MSVAEILRAGLAEAERSGGKRVDLRHLDESQVEGLANATLAYLQSRPGRPGSRSGWTVVSPARAAVMPWWAGQAGLATATERSRLRQLRSQVYELLQERGL